LKNRKIYPDSYLYMSTKKLKISKNSNFPSN
jgi:hypothetical protein